MVSCARLKSTRRNGKRLGSQGSRRLILMDRALVPMLRALCPTQVVRVPLMARVGVAARIITEDTAVAISPSNFSRDLVVEGAKVVVTIPSGGITTDLRARIGLLEREIVGDWSSKMDSRCVLMSVSQSSIVAATSVS